MSTTDPELTLDVLQHMRFGEWFEGDITRWIDNISTLNWTVLHVQQNILHGFRDYIDGLKELLQPAFKDSESLNIQCTLDHNYLCTIISCTQRNSYKRVVVVWPGGRQEVWEMTVDKSPRDGKPYIENFICSAYQMDGNRIAHTLSSADMCALLRQLEALK